MFFGIVNAALAAIDEPIQKPGRIVWSTVDRAHLVMNDKPVQKTGAARSEKKASMRAAGMKQNPAFDSWLEKKLHTMFDAVAAEPLPPDLLKLLDELDKKTGTEPGGKKED
jgi:hypothetical protein